MVHDAVVVEAVLDAARRAAHWAVRALAELRRAAESRKRVAVPHFQLNLDLPAEQRWTEIATQYKDKAPALMEYLKENLPSWAIPIVQEIGKDIRPYFKDYGDEEEEAIRGDQTSAQQTSRAASPTRGVHHDAHLLVVDVKSVDFCWERFQMEYPRMKNLLDVKGMFISGDKDSFDDVYVVTELMETDLATVLRSSQPLSADHGQFFLYQLLKELAMGLQENLQL